MFVGGEVGRERERMKVYASHDYFVSRFLASAYHSLFDRFPFVLLILILILILILLVILNINPYFILILILILSICS